MKKRLIACGFAAAAIAVFLTGCKGGSSGESLPAAVLPP